MTNLSLIPSLTHYSCVLILTNMVHACPSLFHYNRAFLFFIYLFSFRIINSLKVASFIFIIFIFNMDFSYEWTIFSVFFPHTFINWWDSQWTGIHIQCFSKLIIIKAYSWPHECDQKKKKGLISFLSIATMVTWNSWMETQNILGHRHFLTKHAYLNSCGQWIIKITPYPGAQNTDRAGVRSSSKPLQTLTCLKISKIPSIYN